MKKFAFTLAEVLIVMALIGFLSMLMLPTLMQKSSSTKFIEEAKTAQGKLQDALDAAMKANNGALPQDWASVKSASDKSDAIVKELAKKLQIMSFCQGSPKGCFASSGYRTLNGKPTKVISDQMQKPEFYYNKELTFTGNDEENSDNQTSAVQERVPAEPEFSSTYITLLDGSAVVLKTYSDKCNALMPSGDTLERPLCGVIYVDVNGPSIPNMLGVDVFGFWIAGQTILPMGFYGDGFTFAKNCLFETPYSNKYNGLGCTAWALGNKNMEYRKCLAGSRLDWQKATRCDQPK